MKQRLLGVELLLLAALITGCRTTHIQTPPVQTVPAPKQTLQEKKSALKSKQKSPTLPAVLGGMVQSDEWVIYKDKEQEEFKGNVFYDNGIYTFKAGYALSDRKNHTFTASQNVYVKQQEPGTVYEATADNARYNYQTGKGVLTASAKKQVRLQLQEGTQQTVTAHANRVQFDTNAQIFVLSGNVLVTRVTPEGTQTARAQKATLKQLEN